MKQILFAISLFMLLAFPFVADAQNSTNLNYCEWVDLGSTPVQLRYAELNTEGQITNYKVQVRINAEGEKYRKDGPEPKIQGYYLELGPTNMLIDNLVKDPQYIAINIDKNYKGVYTITTIFSINNDAATIYYKLGKDGFYMHYRNNNENRYAAHEPFMHCFDWTMPMTMGTVNENRCLYKGYQKENVIEVK